MSSAHDGLNLGSWWYGALKLQAGLSRWRYQQLLLPHRALVPDEVNYHPEVVEPQIDDSSGRIVYRRTEFDPVRVLQARSDLDIDPSPVLLHELGDPGTRMAVSDDTHMNLLRGWRQCACGERERLPSPSSLGDGDRRHGALARC